MQRREPKERSRQELFASLPPEWPETNPRERIRQATLDSGRKVIVLDDDPTGTQTVHDLPVLTEWTPAALGTAWAEAGTTFYILTNSRRYPLEEAATNNRQIARNVAQVARSQGVEPVPTQGEFDPNMHEAISSEPNDEVESGHIIETLRGGYTHKGQTLRPALVRVAM